MLTDTKLIQPAPPLDRQELVVDRRADGPAEARRQPEHRLLASRESAGYLRAFDLGVLGVEGPARKTTLSRELLDRTPDSGIGQSNQSVARQASALAKIRELRPMVPPPPFGLAGEL